MTDSVKRPFAGAIVEYHGSIPSLHGRYRTDGPCHCRHCLREWDEGIFGTEARFELASADGVHLEHVRESSITVIEPAPPTASG